MACVKIAQTCLLNVNNRNDKIQNIKKNKIQKQQQQKILKKTKYKNKKHNVHLRTLFFTQHMATHIIWQHTSYGNTHHRVDYIIG
jgi:uncharacterized protein (DUF2344 family)